VPAFAHPFLDAIMRKLRRSLAGPIVGGRRAPLALTPTDCRKRGSCRYLLQLVPAGMAPFSRSGWVAPWPSTMPCQAPA